ncbi:MAG: M24 family metallopeptidase [Candidatus Hodarchaeota archaeon]
MNKFEKAQQILHELNGNGWLIFCNDDGDINSRFLLGVESHARHFIYVASDGNHKIFPVVMEANMIKKSLKRKGIKAEIIPYNTLNDLIDKIKLVINQPKIALNFGENVFDPEGTPDADFLSVGAYFALRKLAPNTEFISAAPIIYGLRSVKSPEQLKDLRNVCKATIEILETIPDLVKIGMTERELKAKIEYEYSKLGKPSFPAIVATGKHSADPHHNSSNKKIESGVLLIDTGMQINEMCSDITWTFWMGNNPPDEFIQAYNVLYESKIIANKYYTHGTPNFLPAKKCREFLAERGYDHKKLFFHGLGHSLGFVSHDIGARINLSVSENYRLKENMVYTNEPGLYWIEKWGIRLEDDIVIAKEKCEQITHVPKAPINI